MFVAGLIAGTLILFFAQPGNRVLRAAQTISWSKFSDVTLTERLLQDTAAWTIWKEHPWFGVGGGGYHHYVRLLTDENAHALVLSKSVENVNNDSLQFLAEHGMLGFSFMLASVVLLLVPLVRRLRAVQKEPDEGWSEHLVVFRISPITVMLLAGVAAVFVQSLLDRPFRSPAVLVTWTIALVCAPAFLPAVRRQTIQNQPETAPPEPAI
jgi:O-antigen ligase